MDQKDSANVSLITLVLIFCYIAGHRRNCKAEYKPEKDLLTIQLLNCPTLDGDIRILFQTANKDVPKGRVCKRMSCKQSKIIVYICKYRGSPVQYGFQTVLNSMVFSVQYGFLIFNFFFQHFMISQLVIITKVLQIIAINYAIYTFIN